MEELISFTSIPAITVTVFLFAELLKAFFPSEGIKRMIPALCGALGMVLGILCGLFLPEISSDNLLIAAATGISSGFAATGVHQLGKKLVHCGNGTDGDAGDDLISVDTFTEADHDNGGDE